VCGVTGLWDPAGCLAPDEAGAASVTMARCLRRRGPDDEGYFQEPEAGLALGHRRLAILDVSAQGHQPMRSASGRFVLAYNGEVYNFRDLRRTLESCGHAFRGHSDTEVLLAAVEQWGLCEALRRANGMFALALWDRRDRTLTLARDRLGIKPLYFGWAGGLFLFGSELKALRAAPGFDASIDRDALTLFLRHSYVPAPHSIYRGIYKLMPGTLLHVDGELARRPRSLEELSSKVTTFWSARQVAERGADTRFAGSPEEAVSELERLLGDSIRLRMESDVPLGAFLSGGVDSSTVVALMQAYSDRPVRTFSIGFNEDIFDEARHARAVAEHLGTEHTELCVTPRQAMEVIPDLPGIYDEPFADSSQVPTFLVSRLAREHVTVSLSGDGGDELFCGYNRYFWGRRIWSKAGRIPAGVRRNIARMLQGSPGLWGKLVDAGLRVAPARYRVNDPAAKIELLASVLNMPSPDALYRKLVSHWNEPEALVPGARELSTALTDPARKAGLDDYTERMMFTDIVSYLPDDILTKVDRASMAVSLEARVPLLDHRVVELATTLPLEWKLRHPQGKWPLRQVLYRHVPKRLIERPKQGFGVPIEDWLRGPLREWAENLLNGGRLAEQGLLDPAPIRRMWENHLSGKASEHYRLWDVLMFQAWLQAQTAEPVSEGGSAPGGRQAFAPQEADQRCPWT